MADGSSRSFVYLNCAIVAYILSLATTVANDSVESSEILCLVANAAKDRPTKTAMMVFQHPQPALLYICPYVLMASLGVALARWSLSTA